MSKESRPMEVIKHNLDCKCHRRREWIKVNGKWCPIEFSVDAPNEPPMTEEEKTNVALILQQHLSKESESPTISVLETVQKNKKEII